MKTLILVVALTITNLASACQWNTDCTMGSTCVKQAFQMYGVCMGGMNPGNSNDEQPVYQPLQMQGTYGNTCMSDFNCGIGGHCSKGQFQMQGVCE